MAAEVEEVVVGCDVRQAEDFGEGRGQDLFLWGAGTAPVSGRGVDRGGEGAAVDLPVRVTGIRSRATMAAGTM